MRRFPRLKTPPEVPHNASRKALVASTSTNFAARHLKAARSGCLRVEVTTEQGKRGHALKCRSQQTDGDSELSETGQSKPPVSLQIGTPVVVVEAPPFVKSAEPMPMLRENKGQVKEGDVGR